MGYDNIIGLSECSQHSGFIFAQTGLCFHVENGQVHSDNTPAIYLHSNNGVGEIWVKHGRVHREGAPAVIRPARQNPEPHVPGMLFDGVSVEEWWVDGLPYRLGAAAITFDNGRKGWYETPGKLHRAGDEPTIEYPRPYGEYEHGPDRYHKYGKLHRAFGEAVLGFPKNSKLRYDDPELGEYYLYGVNLSTVCSLPADTVRLHMKNHVDPEGNFKDDEFFIHPENTPAWEYVLGFGHKLYSYEFLEEHVRLALILYHNP